MENQGLGLPLLEAIKSVSMSHVTDSGPRARGYLTKYLYGTPDGKHGLPDGKRDIIGEFAQILKGRFGFEYFESMEDKKGGTSFLLRVLDESGPEVFVRFSVKEGANDIGRLLHEDIYQPFFSRQIIVDNQIYMMELMTVAPSRIMDDHNEKVRETINRLKEAGIRYADPHVRENNFCANQTGDKAVVLDGGAPEIENAKLYTQYLERNGHLCEMIGNFESFAHLREYLPDASHADRDLVTNDRPIPAPSLLRRLEQREFQHTGHGGPL